MLQNGHVGSRADSGATDTTSRLILDFLEWLAPEPRAYREVMEAWRTSCPRLTVWEDAVDCGYVRRTRLADHRVVIELTLCGRRLLSQAGRSRRD